MEHLFRLQQRRTDVKTEIAAGFTTYCSMIYLVGVIVPMLSETGMEETAVFTSVLFASGVGCIIMGLLANYPVALAPGLGITALFSSTVCGKMGYSWQAGLSAVFITGIAFLLLAVTGARKTIMLSIPSHLKNAISAGIGCFLTFIGLKNSGIIVSDSHNLVGLGKIYNAEVLVSLFGLVVLLGLITSNTKFPILKGMIITMIVGLVLGNFCNSPGLPRFSTESAFFGFSWSNFGAFSEGFSELFSSVDVVVVFISILFVDFFDTTGTLIAVITRAKFPIINGEPENLDRALASDALGSIVGAVLGSPSINSYIESETGITAGGRSGLTSITTGILFMVSVFLYPVFNLMTVCVTSPVLIIVGSLMVRQFGKINWHDYMEAVSGFATIIMMVLTYSIADGIAFGFIIYGLTALFSRRYQEVSPLMWAMIGLFCIYFLMI